MIVKKLLYNNIVKLNLFLYFGSQPLYLDLFCLWATFYKQNNLLELKIVFLMVPKRFLVITRKI